MVLKVHKKNIRLIREGFNKTTIKAINTDPDDLVVQTAWTLAARHAPGSVAVLTARTADRT